MEKVKGLVVTFDTELSYEMAEAIAKSIEFMKHIVDAKPVMADYEHYMAKRKIENEIRKVLYDALENYSKCPPIACAKKDL